MLSSRRSLTYFTSRQASKDVNVKVPDNHSNLNDNMRKYMSSYSDESNSSVHFFSLGVFFGGDGGA